MLARHVARLLAGLLAGTGLISAVTLSGVWSLETSGEGTVRLSLSLRRAAWNEPPRMLVLDREAAGVPGAGSAWSFALRRDAGVLRFTGFSTGPRAAAGSFAFQDDTGFVSRAGKLVRNPWDPALGFELFLRDVSLRRIEQLLHRGLTELSLDQLSGEEPDVASCHQPERPLPHLPKPVALPPAPETDTRYLEELRAAGYAFFAEDARALWPFRVSADWLRLLKRSGHDALSVQDLIRLRSQGVTPHDLLRLELEGRRNLSVDEIVRDRNARP